MANWSAGINGAVAGAGAGSSLGPWGAVAGGVIGGVSGLFQKKGNSNSAKALKDQYKYQLMLQQQAQDWNEYAARNKYRWQEEAGINKLYGISNSAPTSAMGSVGMPDYAGEEAQKEQIEMQKKQQIIDWSAQIAQIKNTQQKTKTEEYNTMLIALESINKEVEILKNKKELSYMDKQNLANLEKTRAETIKSIAEAAEAWAKTENYKENNSAIKAQTEKTKAETEKIKHSDKAGFDASWKLGPLGEVGFKMGGETTFNPILYGIDTYKKYKNRKNKK